MNPKRLLPFLLLAPFLLKADEADEQSEPKLTYTLKIGDKTYSLTEGSPIEIDPTTKGDKAVLKASDHRVFERNGLSFKYPAEYVFEADFESPEVKNWNLSGNDCVILVFGTTHAMGQADFAKEMIASFGKQNVVSKVEDFKLGKKSYPSTRLDITLAGTRLTQQVIEIAKSPKGSTIIVLQDSPDGDARTKEFTKLLETLNASFEETKKGG